MHTGSRHDQAHGVESSAGKPCNGRIRYRATHHAAGLWLWFNCAVVFDLAEAGLPDGKGTFFWDGAAGMCFRVDPANDVVFVVMIQRISNPDNHNLQYPGHATVYQALVDPSK